MVEGWQAALVAVTAPAVAATRLMLPLVLSAVPATLAVAGLGPLLVGPGGWRGAVLAALVCAIAPLVLAVALLRYPTGLHTPPEVRSPTKRWWPALSRSPLYSPPSPTTSQVPFDPHMWTERGQALVAGAGCAAAAWALWPHVRSQNSRQATAGAVVGIAATVAASSVAWLLCLGTPYCLAPSLYR